jgi:hypothetical protein
MGGRGGGEMREEGRGGGKLTRGRERGKRRGSTAAVGQRGSFSGVFGCRVLGAISLGGVMGRP